jgi:predicted nucleic acid-binding protein
MTPIDAGPMVALIDRRDADHQSCVNALETLNGPLVTTWAALAEAMYILGDRSGWHGQDQLWRLVRRGDLVLESLDSTGIERTYVLMKQYRSVPMDLADATLVVLGEALGIARIFTLDSDFHIYRMHGRKSFEVVP